MKSILHSVKVRGQTQAPADFTSYYDKPFEAYRIPLLTMADITPGDQYVLSNWTLSAFSSSPAWGIASRIKEHFFCLTTDDLWADDKQYIYGVQTPVWNPTTSTGTIAVNSSTGSSNDFGTAWSSVALRPVFQLRSPLVLIVVPTFNSKTYHDGDVSQPLPLVTGSGWLMSIISGDVYGEYETVPGPCTPPMKRFIPQYTANSYPWA